MVAWCAEGSRFAFRVDLITADAWSAQRVAGIVAEALGLLRDDVDVFSASLATPGGGFEPLFCLADGPGGAFCARAAHHDGWHAEPGFGGLRWGDGDEVTP